SGGLPLLHHERSRARGRTLQQPLQAFQYSAPILLRVLARLLAGVVVLRQVNAGLSARRGERDGDGVAVPGRVRNAGQRAAVAVLQPPPRLDLQDRALVLVGLAFPLTLPGDRSALLEIGLSVVPNMYCLIRSGFTSASHTCAAGGAMLIEVLDEVRHGASFQRQDRAWSRTSTTSARLGLSTCSSLTAPCSTPTGCRPTHRHGAPTASSCGS